MVKIPKTNNTINEENGFNKNISENCAINDRV